MKINQKKLEAVLALPGPARYSHFIKVAADQRKVWGLWDEGWAMAKTDNGESVFPFWPAEEYAKACAVAEWSNYKPSEINLDVLFDELLPDFGRQGILAGVFPTPCSQGVTPELKLFESDLRQELGRIE